MQSTQLNIIISIVVSGGLGYFCTHVSYVVLLVCTKNVEDGWDDSVVD